MHNILHIFAQINMTWNNFFNLTYLVGLITVVTFVYRIAKASVTKKELESEIKKTKQDLSKEIVKKADKITVEKDFEMVHVEIKSINGTLKELNSDIKHTLREFSEENKASIENIIEVAERLARGANKIEHLEKSVEDLEKKVYKKVS